jgi:signal transduction histidine kinase
MNLIKNSITNAKAGGHINIICRRMDNKNIKVSVKDDGPGITKEKIE